MARLRPRARIIRTIGDQLISGPEAALIELVKNAYDADSPDVQIALTPSTEAGSGELVVADHGSGMSYADVVGRWFEPATDDKLRRRYSNEGRRMLGAKGIGRFAAAKLGQFLDLKSIARLEDGTLEEVAIRIDWDEFSADRYLEDVEIEVHRRELPSSSPARTGVHLRITGLRDKWTEKRLSNLIRELRRLINPRVSDRNFEIHLDLSEFTLETAGFDGLALFREQNASLTGYESEDSETRVVPFELYEHSDYRLEGEFDSAGAFRGVFTILRGDAVPQPLEVVSPALDSDEPGCGAFKLELLLYDRELESVRELFRRMNVDFETVGIQAARRILNENAGIAIFRDGFRVRPYGEPDNDWLELERRRVQDPSRKIGISQVSGRVDIESEDVSGLVERSSREGLEHTPQFDRLRELVLGVLIHVEQRRFAFREKAGLSRRVAGDMARVREAAALRTTARAIGRVPAKYRTQLEKALASDAADLEHSLKELDEFQKLLQSRAALGLVVAQVVHDGRRILNPMATSSRALRAASDELLQAGPIGELARKHLPAQLDTIDNGTKSLSRLFKRLDPISGRRRGKPSTFRARDAIDSHLLLLDEALRTAEVRLEIDVPDSLWLVGYPDDLQAAVLNIVDNATYWLSTMPSTDDRRLRIFGQRKNDEARIAISNSGPLIDETYLPRLFEAGFSLRNEGYGLGLAIAREACRASKGDLWYDDSKGEARFIISFPAKRPEDQ